MTQAPCPLCNLTLRFWNSGIEEIGPLILLGLCGVFFRSFCDDTSKHIREPRSERLVAIRQLLFGKHHHR